MLNIVLMLTRSYIIHLMHVLLPHSLNVSFSNFDVLYVCARDAIQLSTHFSLAHLFCLFVYFCSIRADISILIPLCFHTQNTIANKVH